MSAWKSFVGISVLCSAAIAQTDLSDQLLEPAQYQKNSEVATAMLDGAVEHEGNVPLASLEWLGETSEIEFEGLAGRARYVAVSGRPVASKAEGAWTSRKARCSTSTSATPR